MIAVAALFLGAAAGLASAQSQAPGQDRTAPSASAGDNKSSSLTPAAALRLDRQLQDLKAETLALNRDLRSLDQALLFPDGSRTTFYVSIKVPGFLIDGISFRINDKDSTAHRYSDSESRSLLKDGWHRLQTLRLEPGSYRLQAEFQGHFADTRPNDPPVRGKLETIFEKTAAELNLVLPISRNTRLERPALSEISRLESRLTRPGRDVWLPKPESLNAGGAAAPPGGLDDPRYRSAMFFKNDNRFLSALLDLLDAEQDAADPAQLPADFQWLMAACYIGFGMEDAAEKIYLRLAATPSASAGDNKSVSMTPDPLTMGRAELELAKFEYQRGYFPNAESRLRQLRERLPKELQADWQIQLVNTLMAQSRYKDTVSLLTANGENPDDLPPVLRYNLAVAQIKDGQGLEGRRLLNRVGLIDVKDIETLSLRDKANLALGFHYLELQNSKNARALFGRIRTIGPFSNSALLGLGWAEIAQGNAAAAKKSSSSEDTTGKESEDSLGALLSKDGDDKTRLKVESKGTLRISMAEQDAMQRALSPWTELITRDPMDPAVQEAMLAIPWVLSQLQAYEQSLKYYQRAIDTLEVARKRMDQAQKAIQGGVMVYTMIRDDLDSERGWKWRLTNLADTPETYFMQNLLAQHGFMEVLKNHRDARLLSRNLDSWKKRLAELQQSGSTLKGSVVQNLAQRGARPAFKPDWPIALVWLRYAGGLGAPGVYDTPLPALAQVPVDLRTQDAPTEFAGTPELLRPLRERLERLLPQVTANSVTQNQLLEAVSLKELDGQKKQIERYLTESRFAVARIYDTQMKLAP